MPDGLVELRNLQYLSLGQSKIKRLPGGFERLENLEFLGIDIDVLDLEDALEKIKKMSKLKSLRLVNTRHFPQSLALLEHLQTLVIAQNYTLWRESVVALPVPEEVTLIPHLEILDLENNNQINRLPKAIGNMKYLKELRVGATSIREFPESFRELNSFECVKGNLASDGKSPFGIRREEKEKIQRWFPNAKILIY